MDQAGSLHMVHCWRIWKGTVVGALRVGVRLRFCVSEDGVRNLDGGHQAQLDPCTM